jgi:hypothetical protein
MNQILSCGSQLIKCDPGGPKPVILLLDALVFLEKILLLIFHQNKLVITSADMACVTQHVVTTFETQPLAHMNGPFRL